MKFNQRKLQVLSLLVVLSVLLGGFTPLLSVNSYAEELVSEEVIETVENLSEVKSSSNNLKHYGKQAYLHTKHLSEGLEDRRVAGTEFEVEAANYIENEFKDYGYDVDVQEFKFTTRRTGDKEFDSQNIIVVKKGKSDKQIVFGAHYDQVSTDDSKGAQDNASGVGALLETAERLVDVDLDYTVVFIAFGAEEVGLKGSKDYVKNMSNKEIENTVAMINLDSVIAGDHAYIYAGENEILWFRDLAIEISDELGLDMEIHKGQGGNFKPGITGPWSDHVEFNDLNIPIAYFEATNWDIKDKDGEYLEGFHETVEFGPIMHTVRDNLEFLEKEYPGRVEKRFEQITQVLEKLLRDFEIRKDTVSDDTNSDVEEKGLKVDNNLISLTDERVIKVEANFEYEPNLDDIKIKLDNKDLDEWKSWSGDRYKYEYKGKPWIIAENQKVDGNKFTMDLRIEYPYGTNNIQLRPYPRWTYRDLLGFYDLEITDDKTSFKEEMRINAYDGYHEYDELDSKLKVLSKKIRDKNIYCEVESIGNSTEGREMPFVVIAKNQDVVDNYLENIKTRSLEDPKSLIEKLQRGEKFDYQVPIYMNSIHPDESPAMDGQMQIIERFANEDEFTFFVDDNKEITLEVDDILDDCILLFNLTQNPDGRYHNYRSTVTKIDMNRDNAAQTQPESKAVAKSIVKWNPIAFLDLHGFVEEFLIEPCTPPHDPNYEFDLFMGGVKEKDSNEVVGNGPGALAHSRAMGKAGTLNTNQKDFIIPLIDYGYGWDDGTIAYTAMYAQVQGALGHTIEIPELNQESTDIAGFTILGSINYIMENKEELFINQLKINLRGIENEDNRGVDTWHIDEQGNQVGRRRGGNENFFPEYYILPIDKTLQKNKFETFRVVEYLQRNGVKVYQSNDEVEFNGVVYPEGTYVVPLRQAKRGIANDVLFNGQDESDWEGMFAEAVINFPAMRGFNSIEVREEGLFDNKLEMADEMVVPSQTKVVDLYKNYIVKNTSNEAIRAINHLLNNGEEVKLITKSSNDYKSGDFLISKSSMDIVQKNFYVDYLGTNEDINASKIKKPEVFYTHIETNPAVYWTNDAVAHALEQIGFKLLKEKDAEKSNVIIDTFGDYDGKGRVEEVKAGKPYIAMGIKAANYIEKENILPGFKAKEVDSSSFEGLMIADYNQQSPITSMYDKEDYIYIKGGTVVEKYPETSEVLGRVANKEDFYISGWWPNHDEIKGEVFGIRDTSNGRNITYFSGDLTNKTHSQNFFRLLANSIYLSLTDDNDSQGSVNTSFKIDIETKESQFKLGQDAKAKVRVENKGEDSNVVVVSALFNKDTNKMENYSMVSKNIKSKETEEMYVGFTLPSSGNYEFRAFVWEDLTKLQILSDVKIVPIIE